MARRGGRVHVVTNRRTGASGREYVTHLLRRTHRERGRVCNETVGNISHLPEELVEVVRRWLRGERSLVSVDAFEVERSLPHGHVAAVLALARELELQRLLERVPSPERQRALAMIVQRVLEPGSKLACTRALSQSTLAEELQVEGVDADELYAALDWLGERQERIEGRLARRRRERLLREGGAAGARRDLQGRRAKSHADRGEGGGEQGGKRELVHQIAPLGQRARTRV